MHTMHVANAIYELINMGILLKVATRCGRCLSLQDLPLIRGNVG